MKEIKAIIQPFMADHVVDALHQFKDLPGITISEIRGFGKRTAGATPPNREGAELFGVKKIKLEIVVPDGLVDKVIKIIQHHAHTGNPGDGKVFIYTVDDVVNIRTGGRGESAI